MRHLLLVLLATGLIAGCGGDDDEGRYPEEARAQFVDGCATQTERSVCECALEELERTLPYEEFEAAQAAVREAEETDSAAAEKVTAAVETCVEAR